MRARIALAAALALAVGLGGPALATVLQDTTGTYYEDTARVVVPLIFPVAGSSSNTHYSDNWLACRSGCARKHMGQDLMGAKMTPLVAAFDGYVSTLKRDGSSRNYAGMPTARGRAAGVLSTCTSTTTPP